ncbi:hypothetical protein MSAN_01843600 [Mycena sanguinolenta]|uniref:Uncharacterized protein n=1 Tax=Mycena sanguinolenta TaxID=230812 RepID=A0A8H7CST8_9AGAR|nr:hypothetical protein MSAN_01843600 [Mycena sanguinolenta]
MSHTRRSSLLVQAGDAISLWSSKARRRPSIRQSSAPATTTVLAFDHVIDISAPPPDEEEEERQRLRDAAAHSIGLAPLLEAPDAEPLVEEEAAITTVVLPPFPASKAALAPYTVLTATLPKYYPPSSLRIFALAKQWKTRDLLLSVPTSAGSSHLHLFKGAGDELERLEISAESVVFVAETPPASSVLAAAEEGRHVVKVAGLDVGARRRDWNVSDDAGAHGVAPPPHPKRCAELDRCRQERDPRAAVRLFSFSPVTPVSVVTQRAGLAPTPNTGGTDAGARREPRGDMDVMLTLRMHAAVASTNANTNAIPPPPSSPTTTSPTSHNPTSAPPTPPTARPLALPQPQPPTPTSPTSPYSSQAQGGYAASLAPSVSSRSVRSVATAPALSPTSPSSSHANSSSSPTSGANGARSQPPTLRPDSSGGKSIGTVASERGSTGRSAVAALKGLFARPRSSSGASVSSMGSMGSASTSLFHGSAPDDDRQRDRGDRERTDSFARMGSLLASASASGSASGHSAVLERRIVATGSRDVVDVPPPLANGHHPHSHANGHAHVQSVSGKRRLGRGRAHEKTEHVQSWGVQHEHAH